jgi:hypothetical protein
VRDLAAKAMWLTLRRRRKTSANVLVLVVMMTK